MQIPRNRSSRSKSRTPRSWKRWSRTANVRGGSHTGCLQSLAHYKQQLVKLHGGALGKETCSKVQDDVQSHLSTLARIDPLRRARYEELQQDGDHRI